MRIFLTLILGLLISSPALAASIDLEVECAADSADDWKVQVIADPGGGPRSAGSSASCDIVFSGTAILIVDQFIPYSTPDRVNIDVGMATSSVCNFEEFDNSDCIVETTAKFKAVHDDGFLGGNTQQRLFIDFNLLDDSEDERAILRMSVMYKCFDDQDTEIASSGQILFGNMGLEPPKTVSLNARHWVVTTPDVQLEDDDYCEWTVKSWLLTMSSAEDYGYNIDLTVDSI